jgi:hypothetical protein
MAKVMLSIKLFAIWVYYAFLGAIYGQLSNFFNGDVGAVVILSFIFFVLLGIFMPELMYMFSSTFRGWIRKGIEDSDGELNKSDLKDAGIIYVSLWSMRVFIGFSVAKMLGVQIDTISYLIPLFGSFGIAGLTILRGFSGGK